MECSCIKCLRYPLCFLLANYHPLKLKSYHLPHTCVIGNVFHGFSRLQGACRLNFHPPKATNVLHTTSRQIHFHSWFHYIITLLKSHPWTPVSDLTSTSSQCRCLSTTFPSGPSRKQPSQLPTSSLIPHPLEVHSHSYANSLIKNLLHSYLCFSNKLYIVFSITIWMSPGPRVHCSMTPHG